MHYLYSITNQLNQKIYIGQSNNNRRWSQHKYFSKHPEKTGQYIHRAMAKYGIDNFSFEILASCKTQEDANEIESILINQYNSRNIEFGYNLTVGGSYGGHSEETKQKLREATINQIATKGHPAQGNKWTDEQRNKLSESLKSLDKNKWYTDEVRKNMSEAHKGKVQTEEQIQKRGDSIRARKGDMKCNAPGCDIMDRRHSLVINNIRYCSKHAMRLKTNGTLELLPYGRKNA